jgi:Tfp pilus assembly protein PilF
MFQQGDESRLFAFLRGRAESTQSVEAYLKLAQYSIELNDPDSAQTAIDTAIEIDQGRSTGPYIEAARLAERLGHLDDAVARLRQAYGINPYDHRIMEQMKALGEDPKSVTPLPPGREIVQPTRVAMPESA